MLSAYDNILQMEVLAEDAAKYGSDDAFRYSCPCCGEIVFVAAADSIQRSSHFRHLHGNNDTECERYIGSAAHSIRTTSLYAVNRCNFYYYEKQFYLGVRLSRDEIAKYQSSHSQIELRSNRATPFQTHRITVQDFAPDALETFPLEQFAYSYKISITGENKKSEHFLFKQGAPSFFKLSGEDVQGYTKYVQGKTIYTEVYYLVITTSTDYATNAFNRQACVEIKKHFEFCTLGEKFYANIIIIKEKDAGIESLFDSWSYNIASSENITVLWPPSFLQDEITYSLGKTAFVYSSFDIISRRNTNADPASLTKTDESTTQIGIGNGLKVVNKNAELDLRHKSISFPIGSSQIETIECEKLNVLQGATIWLFSKQGVKPLSSGESVLLTDTEYAIEYENHIPTKMYVHIANAFDFEKFCRDAVVYYRYKLPLPGSFEIDLYPEFIRGCIDNGNGVQTINGAVLRQLQEIYHG